MSLIPTVFSSTDPGAPQLTGQPGSLAAVLDAVLGAGYGTKQGLGWTLAFSSGYKRAYRNNVAEGGTGIYFRVDDSNAQYALVSGYHSMSDVDTGADGFSLSANAWSKSISANTTARTWMIVGNARSIYVMLQNGYALSGYEVSAAYLVGDYECLNKDYAFNFAITHTGSATFTNGYPRSALLTNSTGVSSSVGQMIAARSIDGATIGPALVPRALLNTGQTYLGGSASFAYPYPPTGGMLVTRPLVSIAGNLFGLLPGLWIPEHSRILTRYAEYTDVKGMPEGRLLAIESYSNNAYSQALLQLDVPWSY